MQPSEEQVRQAYDRAPKTIQDALSDGPAIDFMGSLQARYGLHIDVAGGVVERIRNLLLGLSNPTEFLGELIQLGISDTVARSLVGDLNKEVFVPLREEMQKAPQSAPSIPEPVSIRQQSLGAGAPLPPPSLAYEPAPKTLPGSPIQAPMPQPVVASQEPIVPAAPAQTPVPQVIYPTHAPQQGWHSAAAVHIYVPSHGAPHPIPTPATEQVIDAIPVPLPQAPAPQEATPAPINVVPPPAPAPAPAPLTKDYAADPYREPV